MSRFSLVMATLGRVAEIETFLHKLAKQSHQDFELIIVDQNPDDRLSPVIKIAKDYGMDLTHIRQTEPNLSLARNTGIEHAKGDIIAFPDDDCWYESDVLEKVNAGFAENSPCDGVIVRWFEQDPKGQLQHFLSNNQWRRFREVKASSISQFLSSALLKKIGCFDLNLGVHSWYGAGEETDLMFRVLHDGSKILYLPDALVHHPVKEQKKSLPEKALSQLRVRQRAVGALYAKHRLSGIVILRGFFSPLIKASVGNLAPSVGFCMFLGRIEGFWGWRFRKLNRG